MRLKGLGASLFTCIALVSIMLAAATIWLFLTNPITVANAVNEGDVSPRVSRSAHLSLAPVQTFPTKDGWIFIMCMTQKFWLSLCAAIGRADLVKDPRFPDPNTRAKNRAVLSLRSPRTLMAKAPLCATSSCITVERSTLTMTNSGSSDIDAKALTVIPCMRSPAVVVITVTPVAKCPIV